MVPDAVIQVSVTSFGARNPSVLFHLFLSKSCNKNQKRMGKPPAHNSDLPDTPKCFSINKKDYGSMEAAAVMCKIGNKGRTDSL